ncbi:trigger factor [Acidobacteriota bacterium]
MKAAAEHFELEGCTREIVFKIEHDEASTELNKMAKKLGSSIQIKGFRSGKAPISVIRQRFQKELEGELVREHLPNLLKEEIEQKGFKIYGEPSLMDINFEPSSPLLIKIRFEVLPDIELKEYKDIELTDEVLDEIEEKDVDAELENLQERAANFVPEENRGIQKGDYAVCDMVAIKDGKEQKQENILIEVGTEGNNPAINEKLLTLERGEEGEVEVPVEGEEDSGKTVTYKLKLKEIKVKQLSPIDDDFAKDLGDFQNLDELREEIRAGLKSMRQDQRKQNLTEQLKKALLEHHPFNVPESLVEEETTRVLGNIIQGVTARGGKDQLANVNWEALRQEHKGRAADSIRFSLLMREIAKHEQIEVGDEELDQEIEIMAKSRKVSAEKIRSNLSKENGLEGLKVELRERKVIDFLVENGKIIGRENQDDIDPHRG